MFFVYNLIWTIKRNKMFKQLKCFLLPRVELFTDSSRSMSHKFAGMVMLYEEIHLSLAITGQASFWWLYQPCGV